MKSYFCGSCGKGYNYSETLRNGHRMYCYDCPTAQLHISGWPMMFVGVFIALMFPVYTAVISNASGGAFIFLPAAVGLFLVGCLRLLQARNLEKRSESWRAEGIWPPADEELSDDVNEAPGFQADAFDQPAPTRRRAAQANTAAPTRQHQTLE